MRGVERVPDIFWFDVKPINIIEPAVPCLGNNRQAPPVSGLIGGAVLNPPGNDCVARDTHAVRIRDYDRPFEETALLDPWCAGHFTVAI